MARDTHSVPTLALFARALLCGALVVCAGAVQGDALLAQAPAATVAPDPNALAAMRWRFIGPMGNRAVAVASEPGNPLVDYLGAASGGVWKTENGGVSWRPVFDQTKVSAIGALAVSESSPNVVWAGTGESFLIRPFYPMGDGVYKSTDGGEHWQHMGLGETGHVGRIVIDSQNPERVFVCAVGQAFKPQPERGIFRTTDGGKTWQHVLAIDQNTGCSDLAMDPRAPNTLVAGMWALTIKPWNLDSGGVTGGVYISRDGGDTWQKKVGRGLPAADHPVGKVAVAIARSNPKRVYALISDAQPAFFRSDDGGETWTLVSHSHLMTQRDNYYVRFGVSPTDPDRLYFLSPNYVISLDGAKTFVRPNTDGFASSGGDNHDMWIDPTNANRILVANDAGVSISLDGSRSFEAIRLPIAQIYHVTTDDQIPYNVYGNIQDGNSFRGPSNNLQSGGFGRSGIRAADFKSVGGCESGFATPDPSDNDIVWSGCYEGVVTRMNLKDGLARDVSAWPDVADGWRAADIKFRWQWTVPLAISPHDPKRVYIGSQYLHATSDGGQTWKLISPDLTLNDKSHQGDSGGVSFDNLYTFDASVIYAIKESPKKAGVIWVGTNDGQVQVTEDGGAHWANVTKNLPNLPPWGTVWNVEPSPFDEATAYITVNLEQMGDYSAYVYKTSNYGQAWQFISAGVPKGMNSSAHCVIEDPVRKGMLYLGTDNAVYVSWDDGGHWTLLNNNLPPAPVYWLTVQKRFNDLVIATYGRGDYILDDLTALREMDKAQSGSAPVLFAPRGSYRFRDVASAPFSEPGNRIIGDNPPYGAAINFYLPAADAHVAVAIAGPDGRTIRTLAVNGRPGLNRVWWDLRGENGRLPRMLVPPPDAPWIENGPEGYHHVTGIMIPEVVRGVKVIPGAYTAKLTTGGKTLTAPLTVLADPHSAGTPESLKAEDLFKRLVLDEINQVADMIEHLEWVRQQAASVKARFGDDPAKKAVVDAAKALANRATEIEGTLIDVYLADGHEDLNKHPSQLYQKLTSLYGKSQAERGPSAAEQEVNQSFREWMEKGSGSLRQFQTKEVAAFNELLRANRLSLSIEP